MWSTLSAILDRVFSFVLALVFLQAPVVVEYYNQRLGGHIDELSYQVEKITEVATANGKPLDVLIDKFETSTDTDVKGQGLFLRGMLARLAELKQSLDRLASANAFTRPFIFLLFHDQAILKKTLASFQPGLVFTLEAFIYALIGIVVGHFIYRFLLVITRAIHASICYRKAK